jgi:hypothetical protein
MESGLGLQASENPIRRSPFISFAPSEARFALPETI